MTAPVCIACGSTLQRVRRNLYQCPACTPAREAMAVESDRETALFDALASLAQTAPKLLLALACEQAAHVTTCEIHHARPCATCTARRRLQRVLDAAVRVELETK